MAKGCAPSHIATEPLNLSVHANLLPLPCRPKVEHTVITPFTNALFTEEQNDGSQASTSKEMTSERNPRKTLAEEMSANPNAGIIATL